MSTTTVLAVAAASWGVVMSLAPILQIRKILRSRTSAGVSVGYLLVLMVGFALWVAYGVASANAALIVPNVVALITGAATIVVTLRFRPSAVVPVGGS